MTSHSSRPSLFRSLSSTTTLPTTNPKPNPNPKSNKPRLYLALYSRGSSTSTASYYPSSCDSYHWALIVGPQTASRHDPGTRYHLAHTAAALPSTSRRTSNTTTLLYTEDDLTEHPPATTALVRIALAKVKSPARLIHLLRSIPLPSPSCDPTFTCLSFVRDAYTTIISDKHALRSYLNANDWKAVEKCARTYCKRKREQGRFTDTTGLWDMKCVSTFNFWENRETTP